MNKSVLIDRMSISMAAFLMPKSKYFTMGTKSKKICELFNDIEVDVPVITGEAFYNVQVNFQQKVYQAGYKVEKWKGYEYPTIIYHHGAAEGKYDFSFNRILAKSKDNIDANIIAIQAIFNHSNKEFLESIKNLDNYTLMLASSVLIANSLIEQMNKNTDQKIILTGLSLGAFVTNIHFTYFNTATGYVPMLGGARLGEVFINSVYSKITSKEARKDPDNLRNTLSFNKDFVKRQQINMYPIFGLHDQIIMYDTHTKDFDSNVIKTIPYGHSTGSIKFKLLRNHILSSMKDVR